MNTTTPRVFIAASEQDTGKTTVSLGLYAALGAAYPRIGYIKPVGQRFTEIDGRRIDEDSVLMQRTFQTLIPIEDMSPIAVEPDFTRRYINEANHDHLVCRIRDAFDRSTWEKDFTLIEGSGHAGVGSVFDLSNATVARLLHSKVLLVVPGGIGRSIDEAALNKALFDREGVEVVGVVMNKVHRDKIEAITDVTRRGFRRLGLELLGVMPLLEHLGNPSIMQVRERIGATFHSHAEGGAQVVSNVLIGAVSSANLPARLRPGTLLVVPGDREDIVLAAIACAGSGSSLCGLVLSDDLLPHATLLEMLAACRLPVMVSKLECSEIARRIASIKIKIQPGDGSKIQSIQDLVAQHVDIPRLIEKIAC